MPDRFKDISMGNDQMWVKYDKSFECSSGRIEYCFKCSFKPFIRKSNGRLYITNVSEKYRLTHFQLISDRQKKHIIEIKLKSDERHPHKDPKTNFVCMGKWKGILIDENTVSILMKCMFIYNENDCYDVPDIYKVENSNETIYGGNQCLTF
jgi:hypothetical protein